MVSSHKVPSERCASIAFDFGASWIHGVNPSNPLVSLAKSGHVEFIHTDSDVMFLRPGQPVLTVERSNHFWEVVWAIFDEAQEFAAKHRDSIPEELSFKQWLMDYLDKKQSHDPEAEDYMDEETKLAVPGLSMYWADENAIPLDRASMKYLDAEKIFDGDHSLVTNGYDRVIKALTQDIKGVNVLLEHVVEKIEYNDSHVKVTTNQGHFFADSVLVTLPLGVLKSQSVLFSPPLPPTKQRAIDNLGFGTMYKIILPFPTCFWPTDKHFINFLPSIHTRNPDPTLIQYFELNQKQVKALTTYMSDMANYSSLMPVCNEPILIGYSTNRAAELMERLSDQEARMVFLCQLAHYYRDILVARDPEDKIARAEIKEKFWPKVSFMSAWNQDKFAFGSYTSIPVGATPQDLETFEIPVSARTYGRLEGGDDDDFEHDPTTTTPADANTNSANDDNIVAVDDLENGRLFFAGEHTTVHHFASVHGALLTGRREAAKILGQKWTYSLEQPSKSSRHYN
ncbi:hypothetical protein BGZ83_005891 [Gryganskiella cystojenkinii]|nr:hypothetical protein BGZ83_005891 [Gryganskiella cystojenkinii]